MRWVLFFVSDSFVVLFAHLGYLAGGILVVFFLTNCKYLIHATLSLTCARLILVDWCRWKVTDLIRYYYIYSIYMLNIRPKVSENKLLAYQPLRFTQSSSTYQIFVIWKCVYFIDKRYSSKLIKELYYAKKFLPSCIVIIMYITHYLLEQYYFLISWLIAQPNCLS